MAGTYGFKEGKNTSGVYTKAEVDGMFDGVVDQCIAAVTPTLTDMQGQIDTTVTNVNAAINAQNGEIASVRSDMNAALATKQKKQKTATLILQPSEWTWDSTLSAYLQTIAFTGELVSDTVIIAPSPNSFESYYSYGVYCVTQMNGYLTFRATPQPSISISVNAVALEV